MYKLSYYYFIAGDGQILAEALNKVAETIVSNDWKIKDGKEDVLGIEHAGLHMTLKKLVQNDKDAIKNGKPSFSQALSDHLQDEMVS